MLKPSENISIRSLKPQKVSFRSRVADTKCKKRNQSLPGLEESLYYNAVVNERTKDVIKIRKERLQRTESAHLFANQGVEDSLDQAQEAIGMAKSPSKEPQSKNTE